MSIANINSEGNKGRNMDYQLRVLLALQQLVNSSKITRIQGAADYNKQLKYYNNDPSIANANVIEIIHTGTTAMGIETLTETISYYDASVPGSNVTNIAYS